ncbi:hypothetical protein BGX23_005886 [Mortierella sp. AD031]|nr:hypothetical protein BGX23_005886 [Mortierella sp. AD031]KAG0216477.1 hypothetical protein BGX33_012565 [Mortierella sp. NVP41]
MSSHGIAKGWAIQSLAEFIDAAMYLYLAFGGADAVSRATNNQSGGLGQAFAFGIALIVTSWAFFRISGAHFNPAISFSSVITGHINIPKFAMYFISQILGAMLGIALTRGTTPSSESIGQVNTLQLVDVSPLCGAILAAALHILFRYMDFDYHSAGIDAENQAQYLCAQAANPSPNYSYANNNANYANGNNQHYAPGTATTTTSTTTGH